MQKAEHTFLKKEYRIVLSQAGHSRERKTRKYSEKNQKILQLDCLLDGRRLRPHGAALLGLAANFALNPMPRLPGQLIAGQLRILAMHLAQRFAHEHAGAFPHLLLPQSASLALLLSLVFNQCFIFSLCPSPLLSNSPSTPTCSSALVEKLCWSAGGECGKDEKQKCSQRPGKLSRTTIETSKSTTRGSGTTFT